MHRPGVELAISRSLVRRPNHYTTETPAEILQRCENFSGGGCCEIGASSVISSAFYMLLEKCVCQLQTVSGGARIIEQVGPAAEPKVVW